VGDDDEQIQIAADAPIAPRRRTETTDPQNFGTLPRYLFAHAFAACNASSRLTHLSTDEFNDRTGISQRHLTLPSVLRLFHPPTCLSACHYRSRHSANTKSGGTVKCSVFADALTVKRRKTLPVSKSQTVTCALG